MGSGSSMLSVHGLGAYCSGSLSRDAGPYGQVRSVLDFSQFSRFSVLAGEGSLCLEEPVRYRIFPGEGFLYCLDLGDFGLTGPESGESRVF